MMDRSIIRFPDGRLKVRHIDRVPPLPLEDRVEIAADMCIIEIGEWHLLGSARPTRYKLRLAGQSPDCVTHELDAMALEYRRRTFHRSIY